MLCFSEKIEAGEVEAFGRLWARAVNGDTEHCEVSMCSLSILLQALVVVEKLLAEKKHDVI